MADGLLQKVMTIEKFRKPYRDYAIAQQEKSEAVVPFAEWVQSQQTLAEVQNQTQRM